MPSYIRSFTFSPRHALLITHAMCVYPILVHWCALLILYSIANLSCRTVPTQYIAANMLFALCSTATHMNVSCKFYDPHACLFICAFVSYVEPHFSSFYLLCRRHDNTALTPQLYVVHLFACVHFALLWVCSHCVCLFLICTYYDTS